MSIKKSIGWTDMTCNPIKGRCRGGCWYCYYSGKRGIMNRFKHNPKIRIECNCLMSLPKTPKKIFLCSTHDLFGDWIPKGWRDTIFRWVEKYPQHTFQILTKFPQDIDREMPNNVWLGVTCDWQDEHKDKEKIKHLLMKTSAELKFVSYEPLLGDPRLFLATDWVIIGRLTQHGYKYNPPIGWIKKIVRHCADYGIKVFLKDNLKEIWGESLIQEMP